MFNEFNLFSYLFCQKIFIYKISYLITKIMTFFKISDDSFNIHAFNELRYRRKIG